ncbi:9086_t:CDS:1, partial [Cetraspora pellucida]
ERFDYQPNKLGSRKGKRKADAFYKNDMLKNLNVRYGDNEN